METHHELSQTFNFDVQPLDTQVLLDHLDYEKSSSPRVALEISFNLCVKYNYFHEDLYDDDTLTLHNSEEQVKKETSTIADVRWLETLNHNVTLFISDVLASLEIDEDERGGVVEKIKECGRQIRDSDPRKGPKRLRLRVDMKSNRNLILSEECSGKRVLERVRVVADEDENDDDDEYEDEDYDDEKDSCDGEEEEEEEGGKRKRRRVVQESEVCPICMEEFVAGSETVTSMPCSHVFHGKCIGRWLRERQHNCPVCRFEVPI